MKYAALVLTAMLAGCAHRMAEPVPIGQDVYMLTAKSTAGIFKSGSEVKLALYRQAGQWCGRTGQAFEEVSSTSDGSLRMPSAELHFRCVDRK